MQANRRPVAGSERPCGNDGARRPAVRGRSAVPKPHWLPVVRPARMLRPLEGGALTLGQVSDREGAEAFLLTLAADVLIADHGLRWRHLSTLQA